MGLHLTTMAVLCFILDGDYESARRYRARDVLDRGINTTGDPKATCKGREPEQVNYELCRNVLRRHLVL